MFTLVCYVDNFVIKDSDEIFEALYLTDSVEKNRQS